MKLNVNDLNNSTLILKAMEQNIREKLQYIPARLPTMDVTEIDDILIVNSNMASDTFNVAYGGHINPHNSAQVYQYFQERHLPMAWWIGPDSQTQDLDHILKKASFTHDEQDVGMAADLTTLEKYQSPPVNIRSCQSKQEYIDFGEVLSSIFSPVDRDVQHFYQLMTDIPENNRSQLKLYVGYVNNTAVCTAALFLTDCAGVFDIATRPEYRQKGYGSAVFYHALTQAKNLGYQVSILQASPEGLGIYKRFGFKEAGHFNVWINASTYYGPRGQATGIR